MSETEFKTPSAGQFFELKALKKDPRAVGIVLLKKLNMVGRSINCDLCINLPDVSNIHAVVELRNNTGLVYDMNSKNGTFVNDKRINGQVEFKVGDKLSFGGIEFEFVIYTSDDKQRYKLDILSPEKSEILFPKNQKITNLPGPPSEGHLNQSSKKQKEKMADQSMPFLMKDDAPELSELPEIPELVPPASSSTGPSAKYDLDTDEEFYEFKKINRKQKPVAYPLAKDPKADFNQYIFEDIDEVKPIFDYDLQKVCVEVIVIFNDSLLSVDYLPDKDGTYFLAGYAPKLNEVEYPVLGKKKRVRLLDIEKSEIYCQILEGFDILFLQDDTAQEISGQPSAVNTNTAKQRLHLKSMGILRYAQKDLQVFVRRVDAPPKVAIAPFIEKNKILLQRYLLPVIAAALLLFIIAMLIPMPEKKTEEINQERLATILKRSVEKKPTLPPVKTSQPNEEQGETKTPTQEKEKQQVIGDKKSDKEKTKAAKQESAEKQVTQKEPTKPVESYKPVNFKSSLQSLLTKGKAASEATVKSKEATLSNVGKNSFVGDGTNEEIKRAQVDNNVGSLEGLASGKIDKSSSAKGLAQKGGTTIAEIPTRTVVKGSIDPNVILQILREHLAQFRHCYQLELEKNFKGKRFEGVVTLDFRIGASGNVVKTDVTNKDQNVGMNDCVSNVLRGIRFPLPKGGGIVDVKQTINFNIAQ